MPYCSSILNTGMKNQDGSICYIIGIPKDIQKQIGKCVGDSATVHEAPNGVSCIPEESNLCIRGASGIPHFDHSVPTEATEMFHILKNAENPHFYGFRLHTFRTTDKVIRYGINNQFDFAEHPAVIQRGEKRTINICVAVPDVA